MLQHGEAKVLITDYEFHEVIHAAIGMLDHPPLVVDVNDPEYGEGRPVGELDYEALLAEGDPQFAWEWPGRVAGDLAELHLGHHRQPQGRGLPSPRRLPERAGQPDDLVHGPAPGVPLDPADVPLQRLVLSVDGDRVGRRPRLPAAGRSAKGPHPDPRAPGQPPVRRAHRAQRPDQHARLGQGRHRPPGACHGRRRRATGQGDRRGGRDGHPRHPCLRPHRGLRPGHGLRLARRVGRPAARATRRDQVAPGRALPDPRRGDGGRPEDPRAGAARRPVHRRDLHARQYRDEGLPEESQRHRGSLRRRLVPYRRPGGLPSGRLSRSATGSRTSSSPAAKTSPPSNWRACSTATRRCWRRRWRGPTKVGKRPVRSLP